MGSPAGRTGPTVPERILDAAGELWASSGLDGVSMGDVARAAGVSRATLYRYFEDRRALQLAFVNRRTREVAAAVAASVAQVADPADRLVAAVMGSVARVRADPTLHAWFVLENLSITRSLVASSSVIEEVAAAFFGEGAEPLVARWVVRNVVSLILLPGADEEEEGEMLRRFVGPVATAAPTGP